MCELCGRSNFELFTELLTGGKTLEEIKLYSEAFWKNYKKIDKYDKYIERIEKGEQEILKRQKIDKAIEDKFGQLQDQFYQKYPKKNLPEFSLEDINIQYSKEVTEKDLEENPFEFYPLEDKIYAMGMFKYTYGYWDLLKNDVRNSAHFLHNWVVHTRSLLDIQKRCDYLIS